MNKVAYFVVIYTPPFLSALPSILCVLYYFPIFFSICFFLNAKLCMVFPSLSLICNKLHSHFSYYFLHLVFVVYKTLTEPCFIWLDSSLQTVFFLLITWRPGKAWVKELYKRPKMRRNQKSWHSFSLFLPKKTVHILPVCRYVSALLVSFMAMGTYFVSVLISLLYITSHWFFALSLFCLSLLRISRNWELCDEEKSKS